MNDLSITFCPLTKKTCHSSQPCMFFYNNDCLLRKAILKFLEQQEELILVIDELKEFLRTLAEEEDMRWD